MGEREERETGLGKGQGGREMLIFKNSLIYLWRLGKFISKELAQQVVIGVLS